MRWTIFYDDGSVFTSDDGGPEDAPLDGVLGIVEEYDDGRKTQRYWGPDYYFWTGDGWAAGRLADLERWLRREMPQLKYGRWVSNAMWERVLDQMRRKVDAR